MQTSTKKLLVLSLLTTLAGGMTVATRADDTPADKTGVKTPATPTAPAAPAKKAFQPTQQKLSGKVVAVDKSARTVTLQIGGQPYVLQLSDSTRIAQSGKSKALTDVTVGEDVTVDVMLKETTGGRIEVSVLSVELSETATAQGGRKSGGLRPFQNEANPANVDRPAISPSSSKNKNK